MSISTLRFSFVLLVIASCLTLSSQSFPCGGGTNCVCDQPTAQEVDCQNVNCNNQIIIFVHGGGYVSCNSWVAAKTTCCGIRENTLAQGGAV